MTTTTATTIEPPPSKPRPGAAGDKHGRSWFRYLRRLGSLLKETAILSIISVPELTLTVSAIGTQYYAFVESFTVLALIYWALVELCGAAGRAAERRLAKYRFA